MDGHFVPNLTWGAPIIKCLKPHSKAFFDVHLMVSDPQFWVKDMKVFWLFFRTGRDSKRER